MIYARIFFISFFVCIAFIPILKKIAVKLGILDHPTSEIKTHTKARPYLGGVAIWLGFVVSLFVLRFFTNFETGTLRNLRGILVGGSLIMLVGLIDDIHKLSFKTKFLWQIIAATIIILFNIKIKFISPSYIALILTYLWIVGITNAFNLIDVMDGLSSGVAFIALFSFFLINAPGKELYVNFASIALAGACLGFLIYNFPPSSIFMGDAGSLFVGFVVVSISLGTNYSVNTKVGVLTPILIIAVPIFDTFYIMYKRYKRKQSMFLGSKDHFALRLAKMGWSKIKILGLIYILTAFCGISAYIITRSNNQQAVLLYTWIGIVCVLMAKILGTVKMHNEK
ncbi:MraY family glycosyltransferase [bacterium]